MNTSHEVALSELAQGQNYFREHLSHAQAEIETLRMRQSLDASVIADLERKLADAMAKIAGAERDRRTVSHDLAVRLRWQALQQCGIDVFGSDAGENSIVQANARLDKLADLGEARIRENAEWAQAAHAAHAAEAAS